MQSNSLGLAAVVAMAGMIVVAPLTGCSDGGAITSTGAGAAGGSGGAGGAGGEGGKGGAGGSGGSGGTAGSGGGDVICGNGVVEGKESCDDGNDVPGDGCEADCTFSCEDPVTQVKCDDDNPCNGSEVCSEKHVCEAGTPLPDGTSCGAGKVCGAGMCIDETCGDGIVNGNEECDDANIVNGDGCDSCKFSCVSNDPTRDCSNIDQCVGTTCDDATHTCGMPLGDGKVCAMGSVCKNGACTPTVCGDGVVDPGEDCDDGNLANGDGCDADCTLSCANPMTDCPAAPACQVATCTAMNTCANVADTTVNGQMCGAPDLVCQNGACLPPAVVCGNGQVEMGEDCDFGAGNGPGTGCETTCKFSCQMDADCADANTCNGAETCVAVMVGGQAGKQCAAGMPAADCSACAGGFCGGGQCKPSACGDGCIGAGEQCDDSNTKNLDGCSSACKFEQVHRATYLDMQFGVDAAFCPQNALGGAINNLAQQTLRDALTAGVADGSISILFQALGLDDLSGTSDPSIELGVMNGTPVIPMGVMYDGTADLDWWHTVAASGLDMNRVPTLKLPGSIAAKTLSAGPGTLTILVNFAGVPAPLTMFGSKITASIGAVSTPLTSMGTTPGHLASEQLDPMLQSFATMGTPDDVGAGKLCGNVTAASLNSIPVPPDLAAGGQLACGQGYSTQNTLLDVFIGGCTVFGFVQVIAITQPDKFDPTAAPIGAGGPYTLTRDNTTKKINGCRDKNGTAVPAAQLQACLQSAAYSSFFKFATGRVIGK